jgi:phage/plasmid-associated DNA primase
VIVGKLKDFVVEYIPENSIDISNVKYINDIVTEKKDSENKLQKHNREYDDIIELDNNNQLIDVSKITKEEIFSSTMNQPTIYKKMFDECYKQNRFDEYESWLSVGMALKNSQMDEIAAFKLFNYFSSKSLKYDGENQTEHKFQTFTKRKGVNSYTVATIYHYAIEDNKQRFNQIMNKNTFDLEQYDMCKYVKMLAGKIFFYIMKNNVRKMYCFNGKIWKQDDALFKNFLSNELYEFLKMILVELYFDHKEFSHMRSQIKKLKNANFKRDVVESYKEVNTRDDVTLDNNPNLLGFDNMVYDFDKEVFREYSYDDFVSITTGYDWREPSSDELKTVNTLLTQIMPDENERETYLQILSTCLDGNTLEKFIVFNGSGGNGKGMINDLLLLALGNHGMIGNNNLLFEPSKTGSNPEKANIHKKRLVIFREPPENKRFQNSVVKELTGGGLFSARGHHETESQKELNLTMIVECNKKPLFAEEPTQADVRRIVDIYFRSTYTEDKKLIDPENNIYLANSYYKTNKFQQQHKYALIKILLNYNKIYKNNNYKINITKSIEERTNNYLEMSFHIVQWFKDHYEYTGKREDVVKLKNLYEHFSTSSYFFNMTKVEKKKYNKTYFYNYVETNIFFRKYYIERTSDLYKVLHGWIINENEDCNTKM